ncbi:MAG: nicotinate (nicotinamide) nucleotide adenylyltransferase [Phycisphaerales bacterium]
MQITDAKHIILFGGSFDPPHVAHVALPMAAREAIGAEVVAYIPAAKAPHKLDKLQTDPKHRLAMLRLALGNEKHAVILTDEIDRAAGGEPSYTVDTLTVLRERLGDDVKLRLLIGADQVRIFDQWRDPKRIIELAEPLVMVRPPDDRASLLASLPDDQAREAWASRLVDVPAVDVSSTQIRERVARGEPITGMVDDAVERYIYQHGLYCQV